MPKKALMPLSDLKKKTKAKIAYLQTQDNKALQKLIAMGALPGSEIVLLQRFPSFVFSLGKSQFVIDKGLASQVYVRVI